MVAGSRGRTAEMQFTVNVQDQNLQRLSDYSVAVVNEVQHLQITETQGLLYHI